eukprot:CAMPEP_0204627108 /NCGR_PEP_ID=MMETSP0717-20131115/13044_1 /ASSEMBLY_ACC=CAM_ASM_000666 /TAXON_ID=230516 /ORGANISM="Chaetoceros curvisetus" /LENGTH=195 /DNA_ID=CAMNT_0051643243 /DNA_START=136 /DNA_END=723 /DNA_ORIENTATION=-
MEDGGVEFEEYITKKYGRAAAKRFLGGKSQLDMTAEKVGITFAKDRKIFPSRRAHVLMEHIKSTFGDDSKEANSVMVALFRKYFEEGLNPNSMDTLRDIVEGVNILGKGDGSETEKALAAAQDKELLNDVLQKDSYHKSQGVNGVPFFIIEQFGEDGEGEANNTKKKKKRQPVTFSGAYPPDFIAQELEEMASDA